MSAEQETGYAQEGGAETSPKTDRNLFRDIFGIITDPFKTFERVIKNGSWVAVFILIILVAAGTQQIYHTQLMDNAIQKMEENAAKSDQSVPPQAIEVMRSPLSRIGTFLSTAIMFALVILISTVIYFFIASVIFGGTAKFKQVWAITCWAGVIAIVGLIIKVPLVLAKNSAEAGLNLGLIFTEGMVGARLNKFFGAVDLFGIWEFIIAGIGLAVLYKFTTKKGIGIAFIVWLIFTLAFGLGAYFS